MENLNPQDLWRNVENEIVQSLEGYLIVDDTVIHKKYAQKIEIARRQYSGIGSSSNSGYRNS